MSEAILEISDGRDMTGTIGLVINPIAGIGGTVGLKGSDGRAMQDSARARGAIALAGERAGRALAIVAASYPGVVIVTAAGSMGEDAVRAAGLSPRVVYTPVRAATTAADTVAATAAIAHAGSSLILFVGGDGTARDVCAGVPDGMAVLGVPAGVKMYSDCFAVSPSVAGALAVEWLGDDHVPVRECEVLDIVDEQIEHGRPDPRLYGTMVVPYSPGRTQARKVATRASQREAVQAAAGGVVAELRPGVTYLLGPGGTVAEIARQLGVASTPLGVDALLDGAIVLADASEAQLLELIRDRPAKAIVTVIGGQGFLLGRGNQQISAPVIRRLGEDPLLVVATEDKLIELGGLPLLVDTGDPDLDASLAGYVRVITGFGSSSVHSVNAPENE